MEHVRHMAIDGRFVYLDEVVPGIARDAKYATADNLTGAPLDGYFANRVVGTRELGAALRDAADCFAHLGYGLLVYDAYRPARAVRAFARWAAQPEDGKTKARHYPNVDKKDLFRLGYIAEKSGHSRGSSVDLVLTRGGQPIDMGGIFDLMDDISHHSHPMPDPIARNRQTLREGMEACGFRAYDGEWWHYNLSVEPYPDTYFDFPIT
jgi:D-alanyl-D-alanine dipeptidase